VKKLSIFQPSDYLREIQRFTTSQYWSSGLRITAGVLVPMLVLGYYGWLTEGIPFLLGALFVGIIDSPGPIHHRRNGMFIASLLNALTVLITFAIRDHEVFLFAGLLLISFLYSFISIYGARASAIGTLAFVVMLLNITPDESDMNALSSALITGGGGLWYASFSMLLYRLQPYRLVEQALGEYMLLLAEYLRARASFYKSNDNIEASYSRMMTLQVIVLNMQNQVRELLFRTRQFVGDPSPKSRSLMMTYLEASELFEETMHSYHDYRSLHTTLGHTQVVTGFYRVILQVVAELEYVGLSIQAGLAVNKTPDFKKDFTELRASLKELSNGGVDGHVTSMVISLESTLNNVEAILSRVNKIALYSRLEEPHANVPIAQEESAEPTSFSFDLLRENLSLQSNAFRFSLRIAVAITIGYLVSLTFDLSHSYWIMLTIVTILKPVYHLTKKRNYERVIGTMTGIIAGSLLIWFVHHNGILFVLMIITMLLAYSFLRIYYLAFVTCLTIYLIITFHFLDPNEFRLLIGERLVDTLIGAVIAAFAARFIFPVWQSGNIRTAMEEVIQNNRQYFSCALEFATQELKDKQSYRKARRDAIVSLTNVSDIFQQMLSEPVSSKSTALLHQFVIASHTLTNRISALSPDTLRHSGDNDRLSQNVVDILNEAESLARKEQVESEIKNVPVSSFNALSLIYSVAAEVRNITGRINKDEVSTL
jgi:uncharacterized membrane protein YccC